MAGISYLFTTEFYKLVQRRLAPEGIFCQWMHAYSIAPEDYRMVIASVREVFPHVTLWQAPEADTLILASTKPIVVDLEAMRKRFAASEHLRADLGRFFIQDAAGLLCFFEMGEGDVTRYVESVQVFNTDGKLIDMWDKLMTPWGLFVINDDELWICGSSRFPSETGASTPSSRRRPSTGSRIRTRPSARSSACSCPPGTCSSRS